MENSSNEIYFYAGGYNALSNFSAYQVEYHGNMWPTLEHAYQAHKFLDTEIQQIILKARSPLEAQKLGRSYPGKERPDWFSINMNLMTELHRLRFEQHPYLKEKLIRSGDSELIHKAPLDATPSGTFWGVDHDGVGENHLGKILMTLREEYRNNS